MVKGIQWSKRRICKKMAITFESLNMWKYIVFLTKYYRKWKTACVGKLKKKYDRIKVTISEISNASFSSSSCQTEQNTLSHARK